jgi:hypothetical protein
MLMRILVELTLSKFIFYKYSANEKVYNSTKVNLIRHLNMDVNSRVTYARGLTLSFNVIYYKIKWLLIIYR